MQNLMTFLIRMAWRLRTIIASIIGRRTVGVRALIIKEGHILLVHHTYRPLWFVPGGGVDAGESPLKAVIREVWEEVGLTPTTPPRLFGIYYNVHNGHDDYVVTYIIDQFTETPQKSPEIQEMRWVPLNALPEDLSPGTRARIREYLGEAPISDRWSPVLEK